MGNTGYVGLAEVERRLACAGQAIDLALAMRDRDRFHRACAVRAELLTLRAELCAIPGPSGSTIAVVDLRQEPE